MTVLFPFLMFKPPPSPQRNQFPAMPPMLKSDPSVAPALFFLARAANRHSQNRVSPTISTPPSFPGSLPPPLFLIDNVQGSVALFIYSCIYFYLSALPPNQFSHLRSLSILLIIAECAHEVWTIGKSLRRGGEMLDSLVSPAISGL